MPSYETLDAIADAYIPLLALISLLLIAVRLFKAQWKPAGRGMAGFIAVAFIAYGLMFLDRFLGIWPAVGLDYSTHTATSLGLVLLLSLEGRKLRNTLDRFARLLLHPDGVPALSHRLRYRYHHPCRRHPPRPDSALPQSPGAHSSRNSNGVSSKPGPYKSTSLKISFPQRQPAVQNFLRPTLTFQSA